MHYYGMIMRPFAPGAQPSGCVELRKGNGSFWNILGYGEELSQDSVRQYDLIAVEEKTALECEVIMTSKRR